MGGNSYDPVLTESRIKEHFKNNSSEYLKGGYNEIKCKIHLNKAMKEYIFKLNVDLKKSIPPEFIFIIDRSGSMSSCFNYIITKTIPEILQSLEYGNRKIHLITFDSSINYFSLNKNELINSGLRSGGGTYMASSFQALAKILELSKGKCNHLRILIISDGCLADQSETKNAGELLYEKYKNVFKINSQCVRLNTGATAEADGMMTILKLNNVKQSYLVEHEQSYIDNLSKVIIPLFQDDELIGNQIILNVKGGTLKNNPWDVDGTSEQPLQKGENTLFSNNKSSLYINNSKQKSDIKIMNGEEVTTDNYESIVGEEKINNILQKVKMNKILNSRKNQEENKLIIDYFNNLSIKTKKGNYENCLNYLNEEIKYINNNDSVYNLNNNQRADFVQNPTNLHLIFKIKNLEKNNKQMKNKIDEIIYLNQKYIEKMNFLENNQMKLFERLDKLEQKMSNEKEEKENLKKELEQLKNKIDMKEKEVKDEEENENKKTEYDDTNSDDNEKENQNKIEDVEEPWENNC